MTNDANIKTKPRRHPYPKHFAPLIAFVRGNQKNFDYEHPSNHPRHHLTTSWRISYCGTG